jgi:hypothetical protein
VSAVEIHRELCAVYSQNVMSEVTVRQWCGMFKDGWTVVHDEERTGWPSVVSSCSRWRATWSAICSEWWFCSKCWPNNLWKIALHNFRTFMWISTNFMHCSLRDYHRLGCHKFCARWVLKMLMGAHKTQRMASALTFYSDTTKIAMNLSVTLYE